MGELLADPRTAAVIQQMMAEAQKAMAANTPNEEAADSGDMMSAEAIQAMMQAMPLKSIVSFGMMNGEQMEGLITVLNQTIGAV